MVTPNLVGGSPFPGPVSKEKIAFVSRGHLDKLHLLLDAPKQAWWGITYLLFLTYNKISLWVL